MREIAEINYTNLETESQFLKFRMLQNKTKHKNIYYLIKCNIIRIYIMKDII